MRKINRQVEVVNTDGKVVDMADGEPAEITPALPAEKQAHPKENKPLDVSLEIKAPGVFVVRVWNGLILYPNKFRMEKISIIPGKPVKIRITQ
jgi:hypothetical protein